MGNQFPFTCRRVFGALNTMVYDGIPWHTIYDDVNAIHFSLEYAKYIPLL